MSSNTVIPFLVLILGIIFGLTGYFILRDGELPIIPEQFWGPESDRNLKEDNSIRPFKINISDKVLSDLKTRLSLEVATFDDRITDPLEGIGFEYGINKNFIKKVATHWLNKYDWKQRETLLNKWPSFKTKISGIDIHFQHIKPTKGTSRPLLLLHGWPGSFTEYQKMIPLLLDAKDSKINFELVIASLPGHVFSDAPQKPGLGLAESALIFKKLMKRLGHDKFYVGGGDWGSIISSNMATLYKDNVLGAHMTMCMTLHPRAVLKFGLALILPQFFMDAKEIAQHTPISRLVTKFVRESGYFHLQATKPDTIGVALSFSPSGFAAYIIEKYSFWTNQNWLDKMDGGIGAKYKLDDILDNVMVHWVQKSMTPEMRFYRETMNPYTTNQIALERVQAQVPVSCLNLPEELRAQPKFSLSEKYPNLISYTQAKSGGHMNALEIPGVVAEDIIKSINLMESMANK